jgi:ribonuclease P/MRP protein subunit RPP1
MKRTFADLHLRANPKDQQNVERLIKKAAVFGYSYISVPTTSEMTKETSNLKTFCQQVGVDYVSRVDLRPRTEEELMYLLRRLRRKFEVICVICENKEVARQAAKDRRVDLLNFPSLDYHKRFFDRAEAELACNSLAALEIDVKHLLTLEGPARVRLLSSLRREVNIAREFHVPLLVSSGVADEHLIRMPRDMASLSYLFGLDEPSALDAVSTNSLAIVKRNREKLKDSFVAPGIRVVKEGKRA